MVIIISFVSNGSVGNDNSIYRYGYLIVPLLLLEVIVSASLVVVVVVVTIIITVIMIKVKLLLTISVLSLSPSPLSYSTWKKWYRHRLMDILTDLYNMKVPSKATENICHDYTM